MQYLHRFLIAAIVSTSIPLSTLAFAEQPVRSSGEPAPETDTDIDIEVPVLILDTAGGQAGAADEEIDLANVVQTAAKGVTTVQEAPAIVTVLTGEDIEERGFDNLLDAVETVPGFMRIDAEHHQFPFALVRGQAQSLLYMHNGMSLNDVWVNVPTMDRTMPIETIKRIEIVSGPGGVLWGANSYMGIINVITKDAEDVDGVEVGVSAGDGPGDRRAFYGYAMAGIPELLHEDVSLFIHGSAESWKGMKFELPQHLYSMPLPQPNAPMVYGPLTESDQPRSMAFLLDGKLSLGSVDLTFFVPFLEHHAPAGFPGVVTDPNIAERELVDPDTGMPLCPEVPLYNDDGSRNPQSFALDDRCVDSARIGGVNRKDYYERYAQAEYKTRFADGKAGATLRGYFVKYYRGFDQLNILAPSPLLEGGLSFRFQMDGYRAGGVYDGDVELPGGVRLLYGAEAFREWIPDAVTEARQGAGMQANAVGPADLSRLPLACPVRPNPEMPGTTELVPDCPLTMQFALDRTVLGTYINPQWKPTRRLILDGGVRVQAGLGTADYEPQLIFSGAAVYELARNWHAKLNYAEGFRPPVFNNLGSNGEAIQLDGDRNLDVETSQAIQGEVNARLFKGERRLREINFRADYAYTRLENLIQIIGGRYQNTEERGIHSAELLGKIYLRGDHRVELGYTWLRVDARDFGRYRTVPEHWFNVGGVFTLVPDELQLTSTLKVMGAFEDPNRLVEYRDLAYNEDGTLGGQSMVDVAVYDKVMDRLPPSAELALGLTYVGIEDFLIRAFAYNTFNTRHYNPDPFHSMDPRLEILPNPYADFRAVVSAAYQY